MAQDWIKTCHNAWSSFVFCMASQRDWRQTGWQTFNLFNPLASFCSMQMTAGTNSHTLLRCHASGIRATSCKYWGSSHWQIWSLRPTQGLVGTRSFIVIHHPPSSVQSHFSRPNAPEITRTSETALRAENRWNITRPYHHTRPTAWSDCFSESQPQLELNATQDLKFAARTETQSYGNQPWWDIFAAMLIWCMLPPRHSNFDLAEWVPVGLCVKLSLKFYICLSHCLLVMKEALRSS